MGDIYKQGTRMLLSFLAAYFCCLAVLFPQSAAENAEKYRFYRERLLTEFMVVSDGNEPGTGIPASIRHAGRRQMRWGDATINLSNYMAVLATEYRRLKEQGQPLEQTRHELHLALLTKERLDVTAPDFFEAGDTHYGPDGFFIRDDVPAGFTTEWAWKNPAFRHFPDVSSDYTNPNIRANEMSQDQVWNLVIGLSLIAALVDDTTTWVIPEYYGAQRHTLAARAQLAGYRIISMMQDSYCIRIFGLDNSRICLPYWHLRNPYTGNPVLRGSNPNLLKYGFAEAGNAITAHGFGNMHWANSVNGRIWFNLAAALQYLQRMRRNGNIDDLYHTATVATVGHVWSTRQLIRLFNRHHNRPSVANQQYEHLALIACLLHGDCPRALQAERHWYEYLLNTAPRHGPFNYGQYAQAAEKQYTGYAREEEYHHEWSSVNRFVWPQRRGPGTVEWHKGEYNGLDYLLLYNLFCLVYGE